MAKQEHESGQGIPEWLAAYRTPLEKSRVRFHYQVSELPLADGAASKFDPNGKAKAFPGLSLVAFLHPQSTAWQKLAALTEHIQREYQEAGIGDAFAFLPPHSWHITLAEPKGEQDLQEIQRFRRAIAEEFEPSLVSDTLQQPDHFIGHVTGWYFCQALDTQKYSRFKEIMQRHDLQREPLGEVRVKQIELRRFTSMEAWGKKPVAQLTLAAKG